MQPPPIILETDRLWLRRVHAADAEFLVRLMNDPTWLRHIGDRNVRTVESACEYIENRFVAMYSRLGHGPYLVEVKDTAESAGICGLIKRETLDDVDLGYAFLPAFRGQGYALEAAAAVMTREARSLGLERVLAITSPDNHASARLLKKLGFAFERTRQLTSDAPEVMVYAARIGKISS